MSESWTTIEENDGLVVLTGARPVFCAGFDRGELASGGMEEIFADANEYHRRVFTFGKPMTPP